jgi:hypothetical protein
MSKEVTDYIGIAGFNLTTAGISFLEVLNPILTTVSLAIGIITSIIVLTRKNKK